MTFTEIVAAAQALLQKKGRITYRGLAREFGLDEGHLADLAEELIHAERVATDEGGKVLVWCGASAAPAGAAPRPTVAPPEPAAVAAPASPTEGERRQLTVMFCDLVGSTALSERLDPEDLHELVSAYQQAIRQVVQRYEGYIAQYLGDGVLVYFGYPAAHEDDAVRGVQAGLDILADISALKTRPPVQVRIGLHTGPAVIGAVGEGHRAEQLALGKTPNLAARVQAAARPHTIAISGDTHRLVQGIIDCEALGAQQLKGIAEPVLMFQVMHQGKARSRFDVLLEQGLTPMQGRERELDVLLQRWQRARAGRGQVVLLSGEAGIGKSRLLQALKQRSGDDGALRIVFRCSAFYANSPLYPVIDQFSRLLGAAPDDSPATRWGRLEHLLELAGLREPLTLALFAALLAIPLPAGVAEPALGREERKAATLRAVTQWLLRRAALQPVQVVFEDLHWADPSTLALLGQAVVLIADAPVLMALTHRPEFEPPWPAAPHVAELALTRLNRDDIQRVAGAIAGRPLPDYVLDQLAHKTDGVPLYVEEMTKDLLESDLLRETEGQFELKGSLLHMAVPFSLQDSLASRLDRLGPARRLAETASVLGREFSLALIQAVADADGQALADGLQRLCDAGILLLQTGEQEAIYFFKHALLRDAAYHSLLIRRRQQTHARVARFFESQATEAAAQRPELVAHHFTEAGLVPQAVRFWQRAGLQAVESSSNQEAIRHFSRALEVLKTGPEGAARDRQELAVLLALGVPLALTSSWAAPEVRWANERALELCEALGESSQLFPVMYGAWSSRQAQADYGAARPIAQQLLTLAERAQDEGFRLQAHRASGIIGLHTGAFAEAVRHCDAGFALYKPALHRAHVALYWLDPGVGCLCYGAWARLFLGYPDQALAQVNQALVLARGSGHAFSLAYALHFSAVVHHTRREPGATRQQAQALLDLAREQGFPALRGWANLLLGSALAEDSGARDGQQLVREGHEANQSAGARVARSGSLAVLASVCELAGHIEPGLAAVAEALDFVAQSEEHFYEAELHRLRGELLLRGGHADAPAQALASFEQALDIARRQGARTWALRASTSLARLHQRQGRPAPARGVLAAAMDGYTEGFATRDWQDADGLMAQLA